MVVRMKRLVAFALSLLSSSVSAQDITQFAVPYSGGPGTVGWLAVGPCATGLTIGWPGGVGAAPACVAGGGGGAVASVTGTAPITASPTTGAVVAGINLSSSFTVTAGNLALAGIPQNTVLGSVTAGSTTPVALTATQLTTLCNAFTSVISGCVTASGGGTVNFLRADGTWAAPTGAT